MFCWALSGEASCVQAAGPSFVVEGGSRRGNRPALAVDGEAQLCVVGLSIAEFGTCFGVRQTALWGDAVQAGWEVGAEVPVLVRGQALVRIIAGHDTPRMRI
jgi:hypothetical protein